MPIVQDHHTERLERIEQILARLNGGTPAEPRRTGVRRDADELGVAAASAGCEPAVRGKFVTVLVR